MTEITQELNFNHIAILLSRYGFELRGHTPQELIEQWKPLYPLIWIRLAVVEALYQGRYKVISVEQILNLWLRRGQPNFHFNLEFESLICHSLIKYTVIEPKPLIVPPTEAEVPLETPPIPPLDEPGDDPRESLSNLQELFSQFLQPEPIDEEVIPSNKASIDQFTPLPDESGLYFRLKAAVQKS